MDTESKIIFNIKKRKKNSRKNNNS